MPKMPAIVPIAPAPDTAATSSGEVAGQIAAWRIGASMSRSSQKGVRSTTRFRLRRFFAARLLARGKEG